MYNPDTITMLTPIIVATSGRSPQMIYPKRPAQITPEYLKGATSEASPYRKVSIIKKCAHPINNPLKANQPQSANGTGVHTNLIVIKLAIMTPKVV